jgi:membrane protein DedA with SNARE-associated domain
VTEFSHVLGTLEPWIHEYGAVAVFVILTLESFGLPLPGESLLVVAAIVAGRGEISFPALLFSAWAGAVIGDNIGYWIGRELGHKLILRIGGIFGLKPDHLEKVATMFARYGALTVGFARFFNILRQLNGVVAGTLEMDWRRFLLFNAIGGALWVICWTMVGYFLGTHGSDINALVHKLGFIGAIVFSITVVAVLVYVYLRRRIL